MGSSSVPDEEGMFKVICKVSKIDWKQDKHHGDTCIFLLRNHKNLETSMDHVKRGFFFAKEIYFFVVHYEPKVKIK